MNLWRRFEKWLFTPYPWVVEFERLKESKDAKVIAAAMISAVDDNWESRDSRYLYYKLANRYGLFFAKQFILAHEIIDEKKAIIKAYEAQEVMLRKTGALSGQITETR